jgi:hypothetical protein
VDDVNFGSRSNDANPFADPNIIAASWEKTKKKMTIGRR